MEEVLERILSLAMREDLTLTDSQKPKEVSCLECNDTTWLRGDVGYSRCSCYEKARLKTLWESYGIKYKDVKGIREYKPYDDLTKKLKDMANTYVQNFHSIKGERANSFGILGRSGVGKSHISIAIGANLIERGHKVIYMPYLEAIKELKSLTLNTEEYRKRMERYQKTEVLIIDDMFKDKVSNGNLIGELLEGDLRHLYPILNYRYQNKLPILFSTECNIRQLVVLDEALAGRIIESCGENLTVFTEEYYNFRIFKGRRS